MLIVAWLIGESFATGMNQRAFAAGASAGRRPRRRRHGASPLVARCLLASTGCYPIQRRRPHSAAPASADWGGSPTSRSTSRGAGCRSGLFAFNFRAAATSRPLRAEPAPDRQECRAVGDVSGLDGGLGVLLLRLALQRHLPGRADASAPPRSAPPTRSAGIVADIGAQDHRHAPYRGGDLLFNSEGWSAYDKQLGELANAAQASHGRDRAVLHTTSSRIAIARSIAARTHRHRAIEPGGPRQQKNLAHRRIGRTGGPKAGACRRIRREKERARRSSERGRCQARRGDGGGPRGRGHRQGRPRPDVPPARGRVGQASGLSENRRRR